MSSGQYCLIRDLGLVKGGKGLRHHEVVLTLSCRGIIRFAMVVLREAWSRSVAGGAATDGAAVQPRAEIAQATVPATIEP